MYNVSWIDMCTEIFAITRLIPKTIWRLCVKLFEVTNTTWENLQIATHTSVSTPHFVLICALQFADFLRLCLSPWTTSHTMSFLFPIVFGINLISFFFIGSVLAVLCWGMSSLLGPLRGRNCSCLWLWQLGFRVSLRAAMLNLSLSPWPPLKQRPRCAQRWEKAQDRLLLILQSSAVRK